METRDWEEISHCDMAAMPAVSTAFRQFCEKATQCPERVAQSGK
ncbi:MULTISPECIES: hypothetical protein [unclassified Sinorhizobium]|nr:MULTISPECIES: hypothetical protein [unclassified Sinorhizobium]MDK1373280.1 hypothetical protein [Sinorhizobium sp. 6-70]MDK1479120.1 hypothetical protein [Sinorhizobium sp. 6-117]